MKNIIILLMLIFACVNCAYVASFNSVDFDFYNLSKMEIWVTQIDGLPPDATPGRLVPIQRTEPPAEASSNLPGGISVPEKLNIIWVEKGAKGWPSGFNPPTRMSPSVIHKVEFDRVELGIPKKLVGDKICFTYLGGDKWRIIMIKEKK